MEVQKYNQNKDFYTGGVLCWATIHGNQLVFLVLQYSKHLEHTPVFHDSNNPKVWQKSLAGVWMLVQNIL